MVLVEQLIEEIEQLKEYEHFDVRNEQLEDKIDLLTEEIDQLEKENNQLKNENEQLRYQPGGLEYNMAREHFENLINNYNISSSKKFDFFLINHIIQTCHIIPTKVSVFILNIVTAH